MIIAIGLLEFNSISQGIKVADIMKKAADIEIIMAQPTCPGKYTVLISGSVSSVNASVESGVAGSGPFLVDHMVIPRIHHQLLSAMNGTTEIGDVNASAPKIALATLKYSKTPTAFTSPISVVPFIALKS
jgi:microcompartment protein CcmL/EutN